MEGQGSVTRLIGRLKEGESQATQRLWESYFQQLVCLASQRLHRACRRAADEEDVALSAFDSFIRGVEQGRFPRLEDRHDLWRLLVLITTRKAADLAKHERRIKRGGGRVRGESALEGPDGQPGIEQIISREPTPAFAVQVAEEYDRLLQLLEKEDLRLVALWKLEGFTNAEIAVRLVCVERTVERKLDLIRKAWTKGGKA